MDNSFNCKTVGELIKQLDSLPPETRIATPDYYYECQEGVVEGIDNLQMVLYEGVLYIDSNNVGKNNITDKPYYTLK